MLVASLHRKWTRCDCHFTFFTVKMHSVKPKQYIYMVHSHFPSQSVAGIASFLRSHQSFRHVSSTTITGFCESITRHHVLAECFLYYPSDFWLEQKEMSAPPSRYARFILFHLRSFVGLFFPVPSPRSRMSVCIAYIYVFSFVIFSRAHSNRNRAQAIGVSNLLYPQVQYLGSQ